MRKARLIALVAVLVSLVAMPAQVRAQSTLFTDALTGPASPNLNIPFDKYTYTPSGSSARRGLDHLRSSGRTWIAPW